MIRIAICLWLIAFTSSAALHSPRGQELFGGAQKRKSKTTLSSQFRQVILTWDSAPGERYEVQSSDDLLYWTAVRETTTGSCVIVMTRLAFFRVRSIQTTTVRLAWDPSPDETVTGYAIYDDGTRVDVGDVLTATLPVTAGMTYIYFATAYDAQGMESEPSNIVSYTAPTVRSVRLSIR